MQEGWERRGHHAAPQPAGSDCRVCSWRCSAAGALQVVFAVFLPASARNDGGETSMCFACVSGQKYDDTTHIGSKQRVVAKSIVNTVKMWTFDDVNTLGRSLGG